MNFEKPRSVSKGKVSHASKYKDQIEQNINQEDSLPIS